MLENKTLTITIDYELLEYEDYVTIDHTSISDYEPSETSFTVYADQYDDAAESAIQELLSTLVRETMEFDNTNILELNPNLEDIDNHQEIELTKVTCDFNSNQIDLQLKVPTNDTDLFIQELKKGFVEFVENHGDLDIYALVQSDFGDDYEVQGLIGLIVSAHVS